MRHIESGRPETPPAENEPLPLLLIEFTYRIARLRPDKMAAHLTLTGINVAAAV